MLSRVLPFTLDGYNSPIHHCPIQKGSQIEHKIAFILISHVQGGTNFDHSSTLGGGEQRGKKLHPTLYSTIEGELQFKLTWTVH